MTNIQEVKVVETPEGVVSITDMKGGEVCVVVSGSPFYEGCLVMRGETDHFLCVVLSGPYIGDVMGGPMSDLKVRPFKGTVTFTI